MERVTGKFSNLKQETKRYLFLITIIVIMVVIFSLVAPSFATPSTSMNVLRQVTALAISAIGMTMIILTGGIDLSAGSILAVSGAIGAYFMQTVTPGTGTAVVGLLLTVGTAMLFGILNGVMVGVFKISPFMATLATQAVARGLTLKLTEASRIAVGEAVYNWFGQADIIKFPSGGGVPAMVLLFAAAYALAFFVFTRTGFGRRTYAVGGNPVAALASGIKVKTHTMKVYMYAAMTYGISSIIVVGRAMSAQPLAGTGFEFEVITAVVIGGTSLAGGVGSLKGTLLGTLLVGVITTGLGMLDVPIYINYVVKGMLILGAVLLDIYAGTSRVGSKKQATKEQKVTHETLLQVHSLIQSGKQRELTLSHISKTFPGVKALDDIHFTIKRGQVHALVGENGAGKSTLMKVLSGVYQKDGGEILIDGIPVEIQSPIDSSQLGISVIYQELALVPELSVTKNIFMGKEIVKKNGLINLKKMDKRAAGLLARFGLDINVRRRTHDYTVGQMQMIEIAKAIDANAWVVVMDEPTAAITEADKEKLFEIIEELKKQGIAIVYISHRMSEIFEIADEVTILRDGQHVATKPIGELDEGSIIKAMVGRELSDVFSRQKRDTSGNPVVLRVENLWRKGGFSPISFEVRSGEVLGLSGLIGAGRTEIMRCLFGLDTPDGGEIYLNGEKIHIKTPMDAIRAGICMVSEDRRREGIIPAMSVAHNITLPSLPWITKYNLIDKAKDSQLSDTYIEKLAIKTPTPEQLIGNLSGGNQQKCCLAKWLARKPQVIILDEPTRGIDIGAKAEIHKLIDSFAKEGIATIIISSELPEIIGASDSIMTLYEGQVTGVFDNITNEVTQEMLMVGAAGIQKEKGRSA